MCSELMSRTITAVLALASAGCSPNAVAAQTIERSPFADSVRRIILRGDLPGANRSDLATRRASLQLLYQALQEPLWTVRGRATAQAESVIAVLSSATSIGLEAEEYDGAKLASHLGVLATSRAPSDGEVARFDVWLSLSLMRYMHHAHRGRVDPRALRAALPVERKRLDLPALTLAASRANDVRLQLAALEPTFSRYTLLKQALTEHRRLAADTSLHRPPASSRSVRPGERWAGIPALRRTLAALGDVPSSAITPDSLPDHTRFDSVLADGVKRFQSRHGLVPDGILGRATFEQLRVPLTTRVQQIELALERWRWMPDDTSSRFVLVNIPEFRVRVFDRDASGEHTVLAMDIIVGEARRRRFTPIFSATMREVIFRPYWEVPVRIARNEETPKIRRRPSYFEREEMEIVVGQDDSVVRYPPTLENLAKVDAGTLRLRQRPGDKNALGLVKFIFPNEFNTYLHGTPVQSLFAQSRRDFSHGCMRLEDPKTFAEFILEREGGWDCDRIEAAMRGDSTLEVPLKHPIPVHVLYLTAMPDDSGAMHFSPDIYRSDLSLSRALRRRSQ